jgi:8-oxo-dGTP diphosphatase
VTDRGTGAKPRSEGLGEGAPTAGHPPRRGGVGPHGFPNFKQLGQVLRLGMMLALRYTPAPWRVKHRVIWYALPKAVLVAVAVIPDDAGRVLMLRARYSGHWLLPGGAIEVGEDPVDGLLRECREELSTSVTIQRLTGIYTDPAQRETFFAFRCAPLSAPPRLSIEHEAWRYVPPEQVRQPLQVMVQDALAGPDDVLMRRVSRTSRRG